MKKTASIIIVLALTAAVFALMNFNTAGQENTNVQEVKAVVLTTDDSNVVQSGVSRIGEQFLTIEILKGRFAGEKTAAVNTLIGSLELDNYYQPGDKIIAAVMTEGNKISSAKAVELYRNNWQMILFGMFVFCLIIYAGFTGVKALFSFVASLYVIWTFLIPGLLAGKNPLLLTTLILTILTGIIIFSVAGFTRKALSAFAGTICGFLVTIVITIIFGDKLSLSGMTAPFAETLLYSGHLNLNMQQIFYAAIILGASGAAMDIAMDVAASMEEIKIKNPAIKVQELIKSGLNIGRAVIGTMTTTLLLAYSGGYLTLLMLFMTKDTSLARIVNLQMVSAEIMRTVVGSIGLVLVAPLTAVFAGWLLTAERAE